MIKPGEKTNLTVKTKHNGGLKQVVWRKIGKHKKRKKKVTKT